jgi:hypothetical protein
VVGIAEIEVGDEKVVGGGTSHGRLHLLGSSFGKRVPCLPHTDKTIPSKPSSDGQ